MAGSDTKKKQRAPGLGRSLIRSRFSKKKNVAGSDAFIRENFSQGIRNDPPLNSITEETSIDSFLSEVKLAGARHEAEREESFKLVDESNRLNLLTSEKEDEIRNRNLNLKKLLRIPRRPQWSKDTTQEKQIANENVSFLSWRRKMAELEDKNGFIMTPFERNIEVWRQLWRVMEKSDLILQIVDCRNPLLFICPDLEEYALELNKNKKCFTIMNKSDLLTREQRDTWAKYLNQINVDFVFYSALTALNEINESHLNNDILNASQLLDFIKEKSSDINVLDRKVVVGFVGYPNVGKSSTINSLIGKKRQQVSSTPGKTKHFQTIHLEDSLIICDCPGLVFPSFATSKAELICNGVLPVDQVRDYLSPCAYIVQKIPFHTFENLYNIKLPLLTDVPNNESLLELNTRNLLKSFAISRGYTRSTQGNPDESRAAKYILKDVVNAKILWCQPPPNVAVQEVDVAVQKADVAVQKASVGMPQASVTVEKADVEDRRPLVALSHHVIPPGGAHFTPPVVEGGKRLHKAAKRRQPKKRNLWTTDPFIY